MVIDMESNLSSCPVAIDDNRAVSNGDVFMMTSLLAFVLIFSSTSQNWFQTKDHYRPVPLIQRTARVGMKVIE